VYEGDKSFYKEEDETKPVNVYGKSKVASENYVKSNYSNYAILRSSIIYGPQPVVPVPKSLPLQVGIPNSQNVHPLPPKKKRKKNIKKH
jgi:dTDP-4-dehydrorhamnose reductase